MGEKILLTRFLQEQYADVFDGLTERSAYQKANKYSQQIVARGIVKKNGHAVELDLSDQTAVNRILDYMTENSGDGRKKKKGSFASGSGPGYDQSVIYSVPLYSEATGINAVTIYQYIKDGKVKRTKKGVMVKDFIKGFKKYRGRDGRNVNDLIACIMVLQGKAGEVSHQDGLLEGIDTTAEYKKGKEVKESDLEDKLDEDSVEETAESTEDISFSLNGKFNKDQIADYFGVSKSSVTRKINSGMLDAEMTGLDALRAFRDYDRNNRTIIDIVGDLFDKIDQHDVLKRIGFLHIPGRLKTFADVLMTRKKELFPGYSDEQIEYSLETLASDAYSRRIARFRNLQGVPCIDAASAEDKKNAKEYIEGILKDRTKFEDEQKKEKHKRIRNKLLSKRNLKGDIKDIEDEEFVFDMPEDAVFDLEEKLYLNEKYQLMHAAKLLDINGEVLLQMAKEGNLEPLTEGGKLYKGVDIVYAIIHHYQGSRDMEDILDDAMCPGEFDEILDDIIEAATGHKTTPKVKDNISTGPVGGKKRGRKKKAAPLKLKKVARVQLEDLGPIERGTEITMSEANCYLQMNQFEFAELLRAGIIKSTGKVGERLISTDELIEYAIKHNETKALMRMGISHHQDRDQ